MKVSTQLKLWLPQTTNGIELPGMFKSFTILCRNNQQAAAAAAAAAEAEAAAAA